jgi:PTS system fructose-specific IIC component
MVGLYEDFAATQLHPDYILVEESSSRLTMIEKLLIGLNLEGHDIDHLKKNMLDREELSSTAIGFGIALPHLKIPTIDRFYLAAGVVRAGMDWGGIEGQSVKLVFLILGPSTSAENYLKYLSNLTRFVKNGRFFEKLIDSKSASEAYKLFLIEG